LQLLSLVSFLLADSLTILYDSRGRKIASASSAGRGAGIDAGAGGGSASVFGFGATNGSTFFSRLISGIFTRRTMS
jgi:hypothetical protein